MSATTVYYPPTGRFSLPLSAAKPKKKKKQPAHPSHLAEIHPAEVGTHGTMPSTSQYSGTSYLDPNSEPTPPFSIRNERETPKQLPHDELSDVSKSTPGAVSAAGYGSRPSASEKKAPIQPILIQRATGANGFGRD